MMSQTGATNQVAPEKWPASVWANFLSRLHRGSMYNFGKNSFGAVLLSQGVTR